MPFAVLLALIAHSTSGGTQNEMLNGSCPDCYYERNSLASQDLYWTSRTHEFSTAVQNIQYYTRAQTLTILGSDHPLPSMHCNLAIYRKRNLSLFEHSSPFQSTLLELQAYIGLIQCTQMQDFPFKANN